MKFDYQTGNIETAAGLIPIVSTRLNFKDVLGTWMVRWSINRNNYRVTPGMYAVGNPGPSSDVFVTANYKLSFDHLRKNLDGLDAWIMVVDTKGVNVWCAAGKGTFGTREVVNRIRTSSLDRIIDHRRLVLPQLAATGVSAQAVKSLTREQPGHGLMVEESAPPVDIGVQMKVKAPQAVAGYKVIYGPVRAADIKEFVRAGYKATPEMRKVHFSFSDRVRLIPVDIVGGRKYLFIALILVFGLSGIYEKGFSANEMMHHGFMGMFNILMAYAAGIVLTPVLLPILPARAFSLKGVYTGIIMSLLLALTGNLGNGILENISWFLMIVSVSSFIAMNFTGSSTFTSLSGVRKEMRISIPLQIAGAVAGIAFFITSKLI